MGVEVGGLVVLGLVLVVPEVPVTVVAAVVVSPVVTAVVSAVVPLEVFGGAEKEKDALAG